MHEKISVMTYDESYEISQNLNFVNLLEDKRDVLEKSQAPAEKEGSGKNLTQAAMLKKVNNLKSHESSLLFLKERRWNLGKQKFWN